MKKIKITSYKALSLIFTILSTGLTSLAAPSLTIGTIQFSKDSTLVPININCGGTQITTTVYESLMPKITFEIPKATDQWHFDVLITTAKIELQLKQFPYQEEIQNTIDYLKINTQSSYKYYVLDFVNDAWEVTETRLPNSGQIPDRAIIIECYPEWVKDFKGGSAVELPTLFINNAVADLGATEEDFKEALIKLELAALDSNIIHAPMRRQTRTAADKKRILIMDLIT